MKQKIKTIEQAKQNMIEAVSHQPIRLEGEKLIKELASLILFFNTKSHRYDQ